jgi:hypothetical protein
VAIDCESRSFLPERTFVLPQGEPCVQLAEDRNWLYQFRGTEVAASREILLGKEDLPKSPTAPLTWGGVVHVRGFSCPRLMCMGLSG